PGSAATAPRPPGRPPGPPAEGWSARLVRFLPLKDQIQPLGNARSHILHGHISHIAPAVPGPGIDDLPVPAVAVVKHKAAYFDGLVLVAVHGCLLSTGRSRRAPCRPA